MLSPLSKTAASTPVAGSGGAALPARLGELGGFRATLELSDRARTLADLLTEQPALPGVLLTRDGRLAGAVSRRYYLETVGRFLGLDLYLPRPIALMMERFEQLGGALTLAAETVIPMAVQHGLGRHRELVYEPIVVTGPDADPTYPRLVDFEDVLVADSRLSSWRSLQMRQILATVREGLLLVDHEQRIAGEYSDAVEQLFATSRVAGRRFADLLAEVLDGERAELGASYLATLFDPRVIEALVTKINPLLEVTTRPQPDGQARTLTFQFARGFESGAIRHVLVRVEDVSRRVELERELARQREVAEGRLRLALVLVGASPADLGRLLEGVERILASDPQGLRADDARREAARRLHGLKGEAALLGLDALAQVLHRAEDALGDPADGADRWREVAAAGRDALAVIRSLAAQLSGLGRLQAAALGGLGGRATVPRTAAAAEPVAGRGLVAELARLAATVARDLGKQARLVGQLEEEQHLPDRLRQDLREILAQLVRNAVAHGIESPADRLAAGKEACGLLQLAFRRHPARGLVEWVLQDDGAGLDPARLRARAAELGLGEVAPEEVIFAPGFSTSTAAGLHAGRGAGLDLVRERVRAHGGLVRVFSERGRYCAFQFVLPVGEADPS